MGRRKEAACVLRFLTRGAERGDLARGARAARKEMGDPSEMLGRRKLGGALGAVERARGRTEGHGKRTVCSVGRGG